MEFDPVMADLDNHIAKLEREDAREGAIQKKAVEVYGDLIAGRILWVDGFSYSMDDFIADVDIDEGYFCTFMRGDSRDLHEQMERKLNEFAVEIATKIIDGE